MDVTICGVRYREALHTTDRREALALEKKRVAEIQAGKGASKSGRDFARLPFDVAADRFTEERRVMVSARTLQLDRERLKPLKAFFGSTLLLRIKAGEIAAYQRTRLVGSITLRRSGTARGVSNRTVNMETTVLRQMLRRAKVWSVVADDVRHLPERRTAVGRVLTADQKQLLFQIAGSRPAWDVACCAAVLAVSTTCRGVELKNLKWGDVDWLDRTVNIRRSKTDAGNRKIPLNADAIAALARLRDRAEANAASRSEHFIFPACENGRLNPYANQKTWRTAWRSLVRAAAAAAGARAAKEAIAAGHDSGEAYRSAALSFQGLRFHDLRHQAITELAEGGASDATLMALAGHLSREMMEHYSHVRMAAKRSAVETLTVGFCDVQADSAAGAADSVH